MIKWPETYLFGGMHQIQTLIPHRLDGEQWLRPVKIQNTLTLYLVCHLV